MNDAIKTWPGCRLEEDSPPDLSQQKSKPNAANEWKYTRCKTCGHRYQWAKQPEIQCPRCGANER